MTFRILQVITFIGLFFTVSTQAQPIVNLPDITVDESQAFDVNVTVSDFNDIVSMQFTIGWDETKIEYVDVYNMNLTGLENANFGSSPMVVDNGLLTLSWVDGSLNGVTLPSDHQIFTIRMKAKGNAGDVIPLVFADTLAIVEFVDTSQSAIQVNLNEGLVTLEDLVDVETLENEQMKLHANFPNPFNDFTFLQFDIKETTETTLMITDISGKEIYRMTETYNTGLHKVKIDSSILPVPGEYIYTLQSSDNQLIGKMIFVK